MTKLEIRSYNVSSIGYDSEKEVLEITFISGETYRHHGVPQSVYDSLIQSQHIGYYLHYFIRTTYPYTKVH
ncbi:KTSC domain-containing protein [Anaerophilus nitritogenes]|uniref:KTSC domain-containing protein n=1 Tax=Anaerophilus nitritogenes TaxID=2498136 RepID=UPI00101D5CCC|nr:KTSC domain-containing protein [Anaerophilus nitritogenes]